MTDISPLPKLLAGPILRRLTPDRICLWLVTSAPAELELELLPQGHPAQSHRLIDPSSGLRRLNASASLHYLLVDLPLQQPLPQDCWIDYQLSLRFIDSGPAADWQPLTELAEGICYPGRQLPGFYLPSQVGAVLHGSCRKPHHPGADGLVEADRLLERCIGAPESDAERSDAESSDARGLPEWPSLLMLSGDQIYADDVAGPMLRALHQLAERLELPAESLQGLGLSTIDSCQGLYQHHDSYYRRERILPQTERGQALLEQLFRGARKPVFTSDSAHNHLITLAECLLIYLLVWSPEPWRLVRPRMPAELSDAEQQRYRAEQLAIEQFVAGLGAVRRLLAHLPVAMQFDDHDITDDWNLNREWEEAAYGHPLSRRMIGNGLLAYLLNQGWGNRPEAFEQGLLEALQRVLDQPGGKSHDELIDELLRFEGWDYDWQTQPPLIVLDTRTRRWRSESRPHKPSGLIDWEALTDLQRRLRGHDAVLLVSPAPVFGVKLIEVIQRIFTFFGQPLLVDAENWMGHPGTAHGILNVFRHPKTPRHFVVLSGDVHYSFVYDIHLRGRREGPHIWQICSSGLRNNFPDKLLALFDHLNRWLYSPRSPLNWFTRRRRMTITPRKPKGTPSGRRLLNANGIGLVELDPQGRPWRIRQLVADGEMVAFVRKEEEAHWD
ncbi:alkaline phosphatase family protein [Motiliproteus coralliicola]|uniref:Alkaline phosphatase family protein n=1 Tax=Motiliproteus coralliicola TaxID=2283196 RepID=A0A369WUJ2_9GAMM|nr:alkaline phosphatase D family protein [Motiliproteus coralliicola]RDE25281.1 alkaline phosphatase family protein [Motiliproteus coralliicola]